MKIDLLKIKPNFIPSHTDPIGIDAYVASIEQLVKAMIPSSILEIEGASHFVPTETYFCTLNTALPIIHVSESQSSPLTVSLCMLCKEMTFPQIETLISSSIQHLMSPKTLRMHLVRLLNFQFIVWPDEDYSIADIHITLDSKHHVEMIKQKLLTLKQEIQAELLTTH